MQRQREIQGGGGDGGSRKRRGTTQSEVAPVCQVEGCNTDLQASKRYHKRHRVCELHSKTPKILVDGIEKRFCQQCSRFHVLDEFDDRKRSCRKRLAGHNERRRKPTQVIDSGLMVSSTIFPGNLNPAVQIQDQQHLHQHLLDGSFLSSWPAGQYQDHSKLPPTAVVYDIAQQQQLIQFLKTSSSFSTALPRPPVPPPQCGARSLLSAGQSSSSAAAATLPFPAASAATAASVAATVAPSSSTLPSNSNSGSDFYRRLEPLLQIPPQFFAQQQQLSSSHGLETVMVHSRSSSQQQQHL